MSLLSLLLYILLQVLFIPLAIVGAVIVAYKQMVVSKRLGFDLPFAKDYEAALSSFVESEELTVGESFFMGSADDKGPFMVVVEWKLT